LLAVSVFLPWYALTLTAAGAAEAKQGLNSVAQSFGNAMFKGMVTSLGGTFDTLVGHQFATVNAHQALKVISVVLLALAAIAVIAALMNLSGVSQFSSHRGQLSLVGTVAAVCVVFRMIETPVPTDGIFSVSLSWGIWVALGSSLTIVAGDLLTRSARSISNETAEMARAHNVVGGGVSLGTPPGSHMASTPSEARSGDPRTPPPTVAEALLPALGDVIPRSASPDIGPHAGTRSVPTAAGAQPADQPPAGWYPVPGGGRRYWDGTAWTAHYDPAE
jgi:hypothetical protein